MAGMRAGLVDTPSGRSMNIDAVIGALERDGLMLLSDSMLPSLTWLVTGGPMHSSWWGHPQGGEIYRLLTQLTDHPDVLQAKLVDGKVTFVHRRLWPAVIAVGTAREVWQTQGLPVAAQFLLDMVEETGAMDWNEIPAFLPPSQTKSAEAIRHLEIRLLLHTSEVHTPSGRHAKALQTWSKWAIDVQVSAWPPPAVAKRQLEEALARLEHPHPTHAGLPWQREVPSTFR